MPVSLLHRSSVRLVDISRYRAVLSVHAFGYFRRYTDDRIALKVLVSLSSTFRSSMNLIASRCSRRYSLRQLNRPFSPSSVSIQHHPLLSVPAFLYAAQYTRVCSGYLLHAFHHALFLNHCNRQQHGIHWSKQPAWKTGSFHSESAATQRIYCEPLTAHHFSIGDVRTPLCRNALREH